MLGRQWAPPGTSQSHVLCTLGHPNVEKQSELSLHAATYILNIRGKHLSNPAKYSNRIKSFIRTKKGKRSSQTQVSSDSYFSCCFPFKKKAAAELISSEGVDDDPEVGKMTDFRPLTSTLGGRGMGSRDKHVTS